MMTFLSLSSNSPETLAPANNDARSKVNILSPLKSWGTSPRTILCASPSTTAVFPVPGAPMIIGLFFVFLDRICRILLISSSRPITGSRRPSFAISVRQVANFLKLRVLFESV